MIDRRKFMTLLGLSPAAGLKVVEQPDLEIPLQDNPHNLPVVEFDSIGMGATRTTCVDISPT